MKFRISLLLLTFALAMSSTLMAHAGDCSNSTIQGTYAFTIHGQVFLPNGSTLLIDGGARSAKKSTWGTLTGSWVPHEVRDLVLDFVRRWSEKTEIGVGRFIQL